MRSYKVEGIILSRSNFSEADRLVTVFTKQLGKIKIVAKGIRRLNSRRAPHLELVNRIEAVAHTGKTFDTIIEAKTLDDYRSLKKDLKLSGYLFYLVEVLDRILPEHQPHPEIYAVFLSSLGRLDYNSANVVKEFVVQLLWDLGYLPKGQYPKMGVTDFVEQVVEKRIKSKNFLEKI